MLLSAGQNMTCCHQKQKDLRSNKALDGNVGMLQEKQGGIVILPAHLSMSLALSLFLYTLFLIHFASLPNKNVAGVYAQLNK